MLAYTREFLIDKLNELSVFQKEFNRSGQLEALDDWFSELEEGIGKLRNPLSTSVANTQSELQAIIGGFRKEGIEEALSLRKAKKIGISLTLVEFGETLTAEVVSIDQKFEVMSDKLAQLIAGASSISPLPVYNSNMTKWRTEVWGELGKHEATQAMYVYLTSSLAKADRDYLLDTMLTRLAEDM